MIEFPKNEEIVEGDGFTARHSSPFGDKGSVDVEFKPGESTETARADRETRQRVE